ncbi:MAG: peptidylprolyl isomerase [Candidatus Micrarchaeota archaeon]
MANGKLESGDFIKLEFTGTRAASGEMFDTTNEEKARAAKIYDEKAVYKPRLVVLGRKQIIQGLEEALLGMGVGEEKRVEVPPEKGFGSRNPDLVRVLPISEFKKHDIEPYPGMVVDLDGVAAFVKSVSGGRVMVDLNPQLAGEKLIYDIKVVEKITETKGKVAAVLDSNNIKGDASISGDVAEITFREGRRDADFVVSKLAAVNAVLALIPEIKKIRTIEEYERKEQAQTAQTEEKK